MHKLHFSIVIEGSKEKVWDTMLGEDTYRAWTEIFTPGSHYVGNWDKGTRILFLAPGDGGRMSGMVSRIKENRPFEHVSIEHLGVMRDGKEDHTSEEVRGWAGALENYTFKDLGGRTEVIVEMDTADQYLEMFKEIWPKALQRLKELVEEKG